MNILLIVGALIIFICIFLNKVSSRLGIPVLLLFILLGVLLGWHDEVSIEMTKRAGDICTVALIFIMFYGGFGTNWKAAKPVAFESGLLATVGVALTAGIVGVFCHFALGWGWIEGMIMGSVISSTDAATVFSILRTRKMGLKNNTAPMLELESGSNDPCSYMLTAVMLSVLAGTASGGQVVWMIFSQLVFGALGGILIAQGAAFVLRRFTLPKGFDMLFIVAVAIFGYAFPALIGGNGYLSVYIVGIILGNYEFKDLVLPEDVKLLMVFRDGQKIITKGNTRLLAGDEVVFCSKSYDNATVADIREHPLSKNSSWTGKMIKEYPNNDGSYVVMIRRGDEQIIPDGNTILCAGDILYLLNPDSVGS